jgi:hypothetical protein
LVCVLGNTFIDIKTSLIAGIDLINKAFNPMTLRLDNIGVSTLVDLPTMICQLPRADEFASRTSSFHLL